MAMYLAKPLAVDSLRVFLSPRRSARASRGSSYPPLIVPIEDRRRRDSRRSSAGVSRGYRRSLQGERKHLLERFRYVDAARKVVGVGSVGTRAWIILMLAATTRIRCSQHKQAEASVLEPFLSKSQYANHGQRVGRGSAADAGASDIMLGWNRITGPYGVKWDFYMRQL